MSLDIIDEDPHDPEPSVQKRLAHKLLGDPRKAPGRLVYLLIFALIGLIVVGVWSVVQTETNPSGSSYWFVRAIASVFNTMWVLVPLAIYLYWRYVGVLRTRYAGEAADVTGWLAETVEHLSDEMRSTDGTTRVISTTDHSFEDVRSNVDAALRGESHDSEEVDYFGRYEPDDSDSGPDTDPVPIEAAGETDAEAETPSEPETRIEELERRETELIEEYNQKTEQIEDQLDSALEAALDPEELDDLDESVSVYDLMGESAQEDVEATDELIEEAEAVEAELEEVRAELEAEIEELFEDPVTEAEEADAPVYVPPEPDDEVLEEQIEDSESETEEADEVDGTVSVKSVPDDGDWSSGFDESLDDEIYGELVVADEDDGPQTVREVWAYNTGYRSKVRAVMGHLGRRGVDAGLVFLAMLFAPVAAAWSTAETKAKSGLSVDPEEVDDEEFEVPWKVRFAEELKHLFLDLGAGLHSDELLWKFGLPTGVTFVLLMLISKIWVNPLLYLVFAAVAVLVGLFVFWVSKKRRSRRLRTHRQTSEWSYWDDAAGRVKTVEAADVTCYMGWLSGRRYASYHREEFIHEFSLRLHQRTHDERVAPSILEKYARNVSQMKPNLHGHLEHIERPSIQQEIKHAVVTSHEQIIDKAGLAMNIIEHPQEDKRVTTDLGHDPRLVAEEYRWLVEESHVLSEVEVEFEDASGRKTTKTLVYPAEKTRLPDMEALHSQFSDRFTGSHGDPYYTLPDCDPTDDLSGFVPSPKVAEMFRTGGGA